MKINAHSPGAQLESIKRYGQGEISDDLDWLAKEIPIALVFNGIAHAVMLATPTDLEDMALGFALSEGIIDRAADLFDLEVVPQSRGIELQIQIAARCQWRLKQRQRQMAGRTGCGLCGVERLEDVCADLPRVVAVRPTDQALLTAMGQLPGHQRLQQLTGGVHAAAWANLETGQILCVREDVGRHNALDKLVGWLTREAVDTREGFVVMTSRGSYELVQKAARAGVGAVACASAVTALAAEYANQCGLQLYGFLREGGFVQYGLRAAQSSGDVKGCANDT